jgi:hypothetical protein
MRQEDRKAERCFRRRFTTLTLLALVPAALLLGAAAYEKVRSFTAAELLKPEQIKGPHHQVASAVPTEGYLHVFTLTTKWGEVEAEGLSLLRARLDEVRALNELDGVSKSKVFIDSAGGAMLNVGKGVASVVTDPGATAKGMGKGVKRFGTNLGRKAKRAGDEAVDTAKSVGDDKPDDKKEDASTTDKAADAAGGVANSVLGVNKSARKWAQKVGADPYTSNQVLKKALIDIGRIDSAGSIAAKVVVPIPPVVSTTASVGNLVWAKDPEALLKENEAAFAAAGATGAAIKQLYTSKGFTLTLHTRFAQALSGLKVKGLGDYVSTAAEADSQREALFFVESAEMLHRLHKTTPVSEVLTDSRALVAKTGAGATVALVPVDWVQWTEPFAKAATDAAARAKKELGATKLELRLTGRASDLAKKEAAAIGWTIVEGAK